MSLQVWLPFTKNINNQGLSNINITNNNVTLVTGGKLGNCSNFENSSLIFESLTGIQSVSFWIKTSDMVSKIAFVDYKSQLGFGFNASGLIIVSSHGLSIAMYSSDNFKTGEWNHIVVIRTSDDVLLYINGEQQTTRDSKNNWIHNVDSCYIGCRSTGNNITCLMNDFRMYDHILSQKEIKELTKGLVVHLPLKDLGVPTAHQNLLPDSNVNSLTKVRGVANRYYESKNQTSYTATWETISDPPVSGIKYGVRYVVTAQESFHGVTWYDGNTIAVTAEPYTLSCYVKRISGTDLQIKFEYGKNPYVAQSVTIMNDDDWHQYSWTFIPNIATGQAAASGTTRIYGAGLVSVGEILVCGWKLEKGDTATPWCECGNTIFDCSGNGYNATVMGTWTNPTTTLRYGKTTHSSTTASHMLIQDLPTIGFSDSYTFTWWGTRSSNNTMFWGFEDGVRLNGLYNGRCWQTGDSSNNPLYRPGTTTQVTAPATNTWYHWAMVCNGIDCRVYQNGILFGIAKTYKQITGNYLYINGWDSLTSYVSNNLSITDFRIYSTALSPEEIKELYNTSASIDNQGNGYAREEIEDDDLLDINKMGQWHNNQLIDNDSNTTASITKTNRELKVNTFYEY